MKRLQISLMVVVSLAPTLAAFGQQGSESKVKVSIVPARTEVAPGSDVPVAIIFDHDDGWHIHTNDIKNPPPSLRDVTLIPTQIKVTVDEGAPLNANAGFLQWPKPEEVNIASEAAPEMYSVFSHKAVAYLPVTIRSDAKPGQVTLRFTVTFQACGKENPFAEGESCLNPATQELSLTLTIIDPAAPPPPLARGSAADPATFNDFDAAIWPRIRAGEKPPDIVRFDLFGWSFEIDASSALGKAGLWLVAALGGFLLNLTPCVLPVIPLKIIGLSQSAGNRAKCFALGTSMSLGVVAFWLVLGIVIASVAGFTATNQLFQYPAFTIGVGVIIAVMAVGMCGLFTVKLPNWVYMVNPKHDSLTGSFGFGIMTAVLSTPCTAPFMGAAAAWAATQHPATTLATFAAIGIGMAIPYMILSAFPALVSKMPRTGPANELLKQVMGLFMLAAAAYFIGVGLSGVMQTPPDPPSRIYWWPVMALTAAAGAWLTWRMVKIAGIASRRTIVFGVIGILVVLGSIQGGFSLTDPGRIKWVYYTPERFEQAIKEGNVVVLEFTAEWCLNCKALERNVLNTDGVVGAVEQKGVVPMKVDLTGNNGPGNAKLKESGAVTIPWLVVYAPDKKSTLKSSFYTVDQVVQAVESAKGSPTASTTTNEATPRSQR